MVFQTAKPPKAKHKDRGFATLPAFDHGQVAETEVTAATKVPIPEIVVIPPTPETVRFLPMKIKVDHLLLHIGKCRCATNYPKNVIEHQRLDKSFDKSAQKAIHKSERKKAKKMKTRALDAMLGEEPNITMKNKRKMLKELDVLPNRSEGLKNRLTAGERKMQVDNAFQKAYEEQMKEKEDESEGWMPAIFF